MTLSKPSKYTQMNLTFRPLKDSERIAFMNYAFANVHDIAAHKGVSFNFLKKFYRINRFLLGLPYKLFMKDAKDIAVEDATGEIVAGFTIIYNKKRNEYAVGNIFTRPEFQRQGIGHRVMEHVLTEYGMSTKVELMVDSTNEVAIHLYKRHGFEVRSTLTEFFFDTPSSHALFQLVTRHE